MGSLPSGTRGQSTGWGTGTPHKTSRVGLNSLGACPALLVLLPRTGALEPWRQRGGTQRGREGPARAQLQRRFPRSSHTSEATSSGASGCGVSLTHRYTATQTPLVPAILTCTDTHRELPTDTPR